MISDGHSDDDAPSDSPTLDAARRTKAFRNPASPSQDTARTARRPPGVSQDTAAPYRCRYCHNFTAQDSPRRSSFTPTVLSIFSAVTYPCSPPLAPQAQTNLRHSTESCTVFIPDGCDYTTETETEGERHIRAKSTDNKGHGSTPPPQCLSVVVAHPRGRLCLAPRPFANHRLRLRLGLHTAHASRVLAVLWGALARFPRARFGQAAGRSGGRS